MTQRTANILDITFCIFWIVSVLIGIILPLTWLPIITLYFLPPVLHFGAAAIYGWSKGMNIFKRIKAYFTHA